MNNDSLDYEALNSRYYRWPQEIELIPVCGGTSEYLELDAYKQIATLPDVVELIWNIPSGKAKGFETLKNYADGEEHSVKEVKKIDYSTYLGGFNSMAILIEIIMKPHSRKKDMKVGIFAWAGDPKPFKTFIYSSAEEAKSSIVDDVTKIYEALFQRKTRELRRKKFD